MSRVRRKDLLGERIARAIYQWHEEFPTFLTDFRRGERDYWRSVVGGDIIRANGGPEPHRPPVADHDGRSVEYTIPADTSPTDFHEVNHDSKFDLSPGSSVVVVFETDSTPSAPRGIVTHRNGFSEGWSIAQSGSDNLTTVLRDSSDNFIIPDVSATLSDGDVHTAVLTYYPSGTEGEAFLDGQAGGIDSNSSLGSISTSSPMRVGTFSNGENSFEGRVQLVAVVPNQLVGSEADELHRLVRDRSESEPYREVIGERLESGYSRPLPDYVTDHFSPSDVGMLIDHRREFAADGGDPLGRVSNQASAHHFLQRTASNQLSAVGTGSALDSISGGGDDYADLESAGFNSDPATAGEYLVVAGVMERGSQSFQVFWSHQDSAGNGTLWVECRGDNDYLRCAITNDSGTTSSTDVPVACTGVFAFVARFNVDSGRVDAWADNGTNRDSNGVGVQSGTFTGDTRRFFANESLGRVWDGKGRILLRANVDSFADSKATSLLDSLVQREDV